LVVVSEYDAPLIVILMMMMILMAQGGGGGVQHRRYELGEVFPRVVEETTGVDDIVRGGGVDVVYPPPSGIPSTSIFVPRIAMIVVERPLVPYRLRNVLDAPRSSHPRIEEVREIVPHRRVAMDLVVVVVAVRYHRRIVVVFVIIPPPSPSSFSSTAFAFAFAFALALASSSDDGIGMRESRGEFIHDLETQLLESQ
jgi:hypothetical protein